MKLMKEFPREFEPLGEHIIGYDSACTLKQYCDNQALRYPHSPIAKKIANIRKVHDRLHLQNHHDDCKSGALDPDKYEELNGVNTEVAEQFFSHLLNFVFMFRNTSAIRAPLWILLITHQWNLRKVAKINNSKPSKEQVRLIANLKNIKMFKCSKRAVSIMSEARLVALHKVVKNKLLLSWCRLDTTESNILRRPVPKSFKIIVDSEVGGTTLQKSL